MKKASFIDRIATAVLGDGAVRDKERPVLGLEMLSSFLPYRVFDETTRLYINRDSTGFIIEAAPLVGADERTGDILTQFFSEALPAGTCVQLLHWTSPRIARRIGSWFLPRYKAGDVYERMARHRARLLFGGVWNSLSADAPFHVRHHRCLISVGLPSTSSSAQHALVNVRESLMGVLRSMDMAVVEVAPAQLIALVDDLTSPTTASDDDPVGYNPLDPISEQCVRRDIALMVEPTRVRLRTERFRPVGHDAIGNPEIGEVYPDHFDIRHFAVRNYPDRWRPWESARLIGDLFTDKLRHPCPVATYLCLVYPDQEAASSKAGYKFMRTTSLSDSRSARFTPKIREQAAEWKHVQDQLRDGNKLVRVFYGLTIYAPDGMGDRNERILKSVYKACGWDLEDVAFLQIQGLLAPLPLTLADGLGSDMERLKRFRTMLTSTAANLAPLQGEYLGSGVPDLLFVGRRGQPFFWSPFENRAGNHNVAIMGKSGSGKSVLLQEIVAALRGSGAKVIVIDDGRSFEHSAKLQGADFIEFKLSSGICINPFSMIDAALLARDEEYRMDCMSMLKTIVSQMARFVDRLTDTERGLIDEAVNKVWEEHGRGGTIDAVADCLEATENEHARNLAFALKPFRLTGTYGPFFNGEATLKLRADFTVFELSDLASREELRSVVLTTIMFMSTQLMTRLPRQVKKALLLDEAWQMLKGGSMAEFIEVFARTCRKYGASLMTATQSLNDYYKAEGSKAALENSDWMLILQQKPETIQDFKKHERLEMDQTTETLIRSLKRNGTEYSEVYIKGPDTAALGRLVLDPYSATLFSSSPETFAAVEHLVKTGLSMDEAIERIAFPDEEKAHAAAAE